MSKTGDEDGDDDCFYESLDRLVSCSTSNSDSDNDSHSCSPNYGSEHVVSVPKFPVGVSNYDLWAAEPSSVSDRRNRLLHEMGLNKDPSLSRVKFISEDKEKDSAEFSRLVSSDHLNHQAQHNAIILSKSSPDRIVSKHNPSCHSHNDDNKSTFFSSSVCSPSILSAHLIDDSSSCVNSRKHLIFKSQSGKGEGASSVALLNKPLLEKNCKRLDETLSDSYVLNAKTDPNRFPAQGNDGSGVQVSEVLDCNDICKVNKEVYTIKDLDNGKEFIINEIREDGMWKERGRSEEGITSSEKGGRRSSSATDDSQDV